MRPIVDPRQGDVEDDASSTKRRTLISLAGSLLAEISIPKLIAAWTMLIILPALLLGVAPLFASIWISTVSTKAAMLFTGLLPPLLLVILVGIGWFGGKPLWRLIETNFWSLNALAVQPVYAVSREALRQLSEWFLPKTTDQHTRNLVRAISAAASGLLICGVSIWLVTLAWPGSRWTGSLSHLSSLATLTHVALHNSVVIVAAYLAAAGLTWGLADAAMISTLRSCELRHYACRREKLGVWSIFPTFISSAKDFGFRIEGGRSGPRGNGRLELLLAELDAIHARNPLDIVLITGDITDAGRSSEWAEFAEALKPYPRLSERTLILPGNHDLNVVDRANPAPICRRVSEEAAARDPGALDDGCSARRARARHR